MYNLFVAISNIIEWVGFDLNWDNDIAYLRYLISMSTEFHICIDAIHNDRIKVI